MSKLKEKLAKKSQIKKIFMTCGRLTIDSAYFKWINETNKQKVPGTVLEAGDNGYVELDLRIPENKRVYDRFSEWVKDGTDDRIQKYNVHELKEGEIAPPFPWFKTGKEADIIKDVHRSIDAMQDVAAKEAFIEKCVLFEQQQDKPRTKLVEKLLDLDLEVVEDDPMNPKTKKKETDVEDKPEILRVGTI